MLIKAKLIGHSCSIDDLIRVFINFNFENDLSQLVIENPSSLLNFEENCSFENKKHTKQQSACRYGEYNDHFHATISPFVDTFSNHCWNKDLPSFSANEQLLF